MISLEAVYMVFAFYIVLLLILYRIFRGGDSNAKITVKNILNTSPKVLLERIGKKYLIILGSLCGAFILVYLWMLFFGSVYRYEGIVTGEEDTYAVIKEGILEGKSRIVFKSTVHPGFLDINKVISYGETHDNYNSGEVFSLEYSYSDTENEGTPIYKVTVKLKNPSRLAAWLVKIRAGRIAGEFEYMGSDAEKVKAVHDYLSHIDRMGKGRGGAFNALFTGNSSTVGYAYAFYAIMDRLGIPATVECGGNYVWNSVKVDGKWYNIDCAWDDPDGAPVTYNYFLKCDEDWERHAYGTSDASESHEVVGRSAEEYWGMVPDYNLHRLIIEIILFLMPLAVFAYKITKKENRIRDVSYNGLMTIGDWHYMAPGIYGTRNKVIYKKCSEPVKSETWYEEEGRYYILRTSEEGKKQEYDTEEITRERFESEVNFVILASEATNAEDYRQLMIAYCDKMGIKRKMKLGE